MKFLLIALISLGISLNADVLSEKIKNLISENYYLKHENLINNLTSNKSKFYNNKKIKYSNLLNVLNEYGFLKLRFNTPQNVEISFEVDNNPVLAIKTIKDVMQNLGYSYYFTKELIINENSILWKITFKSEYNLDPFMFNKELKKSETSINDITKVSNTSWKYNININNSTISEYTKISKNEKVKLSKPLNAYMLKVNDIKEIKIISTKLNHWYPDVTYFDKYLNLLGMVNKNRVYRGVKMKVPQNTKYIKIDDVYTLQNIKRGLTVIVK
jgi:hypothetical protein